MVLQGLSVPQGLLALKVQPGQLGQSALQASQVYVYVFYKCNAVLLIIMSMFIKNCIIFDLQNIVLYIHYFISYKRAYLYVQIGHFGATPPIYTIE